MVVDVQTLAAAAMVFSLAAYVLLDGFDLGVGLIFPFDRTLSNRQVIISTITPTWDGNETWLIMAAIILFAAFPLAYSILLPALYLPAISMLIGLCLRGAGIEFQDKSGLVGRIWQWLFVLGSIVAAFNQGLILGALLSGIKVQSREFAGSPFDVYSLFNCIVSIAVVAAYALSGAAWLQLKQPGISIALVRRVTVISLATLLLAGITVLAMTFGLHTEVQAAWLNRRVVLWILVTLVAVFAALLWGSVAKPDARWPFLWTMSLLTCCLLIFVVLVAPYVVPYQVTLAEAASDRSSQVFVLWGVAVVMPVILMYSSFAYYVFRGKTPPAGWNEGA